MFIIILFPTIKQTTYRMIIMRDDRSRLRNGLVGGASLVGCFVDVLHKLCKIDLSVVIDVDLLNKILQLL